MQVCTVALESTRRLQGFIATLHPDPGMRFLYTLTPPTALGATHMRISGYLNEYPDTHIEVSVKLNGVSSETFTVFARTKGEERDDAYYAEVEKWIDKRLCEPIQTHPDQFEQHLLSLIAADYIK